MEKKSLTKSFHFKLQNKIEMYEMVCEPANLVERHISG